MATDRGEHWTLMEPVLLREEALGRGGIVDALAGVVRSMNCYYSNLIEGHDTHPLDIERALNQDFSEDPEQRNLQQEALAHIEVQAWIDGGALGALASTASGVAEIHRRFCNLMPSELLVSTNPSTGECLPVVPGEFATVTSSSAGMWPSAGRRCAVPCSLRGGPRATRPHGSNHRRGDSAPSPALDPPLLGRQRPCRSVDVPRHADRRLWAAAGSGPSAVGWRTGSLNTRPCLPTATCRAATMRMAAATSAKKH